MRISTLAFARIELFYVSVEQIHAELHSSKADLAHDKYSSSTGLIYSPLRHDLRLGILVQQCPGTVSFSRSGGYPNVENLEMAHKGIQLL